MEEDLPERSVVSWFHGALSVNSPCVEAAAASSVASPRATFSECNFSAQQPGGELPGATTLAEPHQ
jgi:hypothetical protein